MKKIMLLLSCLLVFGISYAGEDEATYVFGGSSVLPGIKINRARGQFTAKEHLYSGDILNGIYGYGYGLSALQTNAGVSIKLKANQNWTNSAQGTKITFETTPDDSATAAEVMSIDDNGNVSISGTLQTTGATSISSMTVTDRIILGNAVANYSTMTTTAIDLDNGLTLTVNGNQTGVGVLTQEDAIIDDLNAHETLYLGETTAISTMTPTAITLDDGLTLTINKAPVVNAYLGLYSRTSAQIIVTTPTAVGQIVYDSTLKQIIIGSGTTTCFDWVNSTGTAPAGYQ